MKRIYYILTAVLFFAAACEKQPSVGDESSLGSAENSFGTAYQLNVYSFADSDGNGWGDLNGITENLDYLKDLGVSALWLSPIQKASSYHGYNVLDYYTIDSRLGTEADFQNLINSAKAKGIDSYMDYVLNHSGKGGSEIVIQPLSRLLRSIIQSNSGCSEQEC